MPIGYVRRAAQQRLRMTRRRSGGGASIRPSILWQHEVASILACANRPTLRALVQYMAEQAYHRRSGCRGRPVRSRGRRVLARRLNCASQHFDHPSDLRLRGDERRRHGDDVAGEAVEHPFFHCALEHVQRPQARLAFHRLELDRRRESDVADVRDTRLALQRMHGLLEHGLELARPLEGALFLDRIERGMRRGRGHGVARVGVAETAPQRSRRSEEHTSELQSQSNLVCRLLLEKKKKERNHGLRQSKERRYQTGETRVRSKSTSDHPAKDMRAYYETRHDRVLRWRCLTRDMNCE